MAKKSRRDRRKAPLVAAPRPKIPNAATLAAMEELERGDLPRFNNVDELFAELEREAEDDAED